MQHTTKRRAGQKEPAKKKAPKKKVKKQTGRPKLIGPKRKTKSSKITPSKRIGNSKVTKEESASIKPSRAKFRSDWVVVDRCAEIQCSVTEISYILGISLETFTRRVAEIHNTTPGAYVESKSAKGKMNLRRKQYKIALKGNASMLIWLGKNWLGQTDKAQVETTHKVRGLDKKVGEFLRRDILGIGGSQDDS